MVGVSAGNALLCIPVGRRSRAFALLGAGVVKLGSLALSNRGHTCGRKVVVLEALRTVGAGLEGRVPVFCSLAGNAFSLSIAPEASTLAGNAAGSIPVGEISETFTSLCEGVELLTSRALSGGPDALLGGFHILIANLACNTSLDCFVPVLALLADNALENVLAPVAIAGDTRLIGPVGSRGGALALSSHAVEGLGVGTPDQQAFLLEGVEVKLERASNTLLYGLLPVEAVWASDAKSRVDIEIGSIVALDAALTIVVAVVARITFSGLVYPEAGEIAGHALAASVVGDFGRAHA